MNRWRGEPLSSPFRISLTLILSQRERELLLLSSFSQGVALGWLLARRRRLNHSTEFQ